MRYSNTELLAEIHRLAEKRGHPPTLNEVRDDGAYAATTYYNRFGSWQNALQAAGYDPREPETKIPEDELLEEIQRLEAERGEQPSAAQMDEHGEYWASTYRERFGSWNDAIEAAGFEAVTSETEIPRSKLIAELRTVAATLEKSPTFREMNDEGAFRAKTYIRQFESWNKAIEAAGLEPSTAGSTITDDELIAEIHRLTAELGDQPSASEMDEMGQFATATYQRHFESWATALEIAANDGDANAE